MSRQLIVAPGAAGTRLDVYLAAALTISRSQIQHWLRHKEVTVNGQFARASYLVQAGDHIAMQITAPAPPPIQPPDLPIIYQDNDLIVIDKPAGLVVHAGAGRHHEPTVADFARRHTSDPDADRPGIVHRLDRDTSGLLVIARSTTAKTWLQQQWRTRRVHKTYQLLVSGRVQPPEAIIKLPLDRDPAQPLRRHVSSAGRPAVTRYRTLATYPGYSFMEAYPETGRTHQLRVHFAALGHPIIGDALYGAPPTHLGLKRQFLHATGLTFTTPTGQTLTLTSPLPPELQDVLSRLEDSYT